MNSDLALRVDNLGKMYRIGVEKRPAVTVVGRMAQTLLSPFDWLISQARGASSAETLWALRNVSFELKRGEVLGVIGANGAGKSTLLKLLSRITEPSEGHAELQGRLAALLEVGTGMHPELTGRENIFLNGCILGMRKFEIQKKFDQIVAFSGIEKFIDTPVKRYSSGMRVRLGFAIAAHLEPEILVIDEVLAVGDAEFQKKCLGKMKDVAGEGRTVLFVSHNMGAVQSLCSSAIRLDNGLLTDSGPVQSVVDKYLNADCEDLLMQEWPDWHAAPGCEIARLASLKLDYPGRLEKQPIYTSTPLSFNFRFWNKEPGRNINISSHLSNPSGEVIFNVWSHKLDCPAGLIEGTLEIPGDFLNDGLFFLDVMLVSNGKAMFTLERAFRFHVNDSRQGAAWFGKVKGAVRPAFLSFPLVTVDPDPKDGQPGVLDTKTH